MAQRPRTTETAPQRVTRHRRKLAASGVRRVEITVPAEDAGLVRHLAGLLRLGGAPARKVRDGLRPLVRSPVARSGRDLVAFFRASPLVGVEIEFPRDKSSGRDIKL